tara:strand:+ start:6532 stop:6975 length:444 start_codon:yes stop_codon:yes gene_type:complete
MRKKHLVKSKSKRNNRSRKSKKNHSRKYRGGDSAVAAEDIQAIIDAGNAKAMTYGTNFAKVSYIYKPSNTINNFLAESTPGGLPTFIGSSSGGDLEHFLYRSKNNDTFLVYNYNVRARRETYVYYLEEWMINDIRNIIKPSQTNTSL